MLGYLSLDIICYSKLTLFLERYVRGEISELNIQQIVTLSEYGHDALDICHP